LAAEPDTAAVASGARPSIAGTEFDEVFHQDETSEEGDEEVETHKDEDSEEGDQEDDVNEDQSEEDKGDDAALLEEEGDEEVETNEDEDSEEGDQEDDMNEDQSEEDKGDDAALLEVGAGKCIAKDHQIMKKMGAGNKLGTWPRTTADCGYKSVRRFPPKWLGDKGNVDCLKKKRISTGCAKCYAVMSKYSFDNCKMKCISSWCSKGCLECTLKRSLIKTMEKCTGLKNKDTPQPKTC